MSAAVAFTPTHTKTTEHIYKQQKTDKKKDMWHSKIGFCAYNIDTVQGSIVNTGGRAYVTS